ncbi:MAG: alkaline phosphatase [Saprospiraceae bacterium]
MMQKITLSLLFVFTFIFSYAQKSLLQSGPMLGYSEMQEVMLWVQTKSAAEVQIVYATQETPTEKFFTEKIMTTKQDAFATHLLADEVEPGQTYDYQLLINGQEVKFDYPTRFQTQQLWQWRTDPPAFTIALGSCSYVSEERYDRPGRPYGGEYEIFTNIHKHAPDMMLWLGDNTYLREADWFTTTGINYRYTHTRSIAELQPLLANTHHYATWDDHDFGPNDSDRSFVHKGKTKRAFDLFWGNPNAEFGNELDQGVTNFTRFNDVDFFFVDNRYFRTPNGNKGAENRTMLGATQLEWLIDALAGSRATFKMVVIGGQVLTTAEVYETYANLYPKERAYLLSRIAEEQIKNVVFVDGDRHHTELSKIVNFNGHTVYDLTCSPLTAGSGSVREEVNRNRVEGTLVVDRNYGLLSFSGNYEDRKMKIQIFDTAGKELWSQEIQREK